MKASSDHCVIRPHVTAAVLAVLYVILGVAYIVASSHMAALTAKSIVGLEHLERVKGVVYVATTGALLYLFAYLLLLRLRRQQLTLVAQRDALITSEHRALAGLFAASVAHDINNVLAVARGSVEIIAAPAADVIAKERAADAQERAFVDLAALSQRLMTLGRERRDGLRSDRDLVAVVERAVQLARRHERVQSCRVTMKLGEPVMLPVDEVLIDRMLLNLILNAADATGGAGRVEVRLTRDADAISLEVHDDGPGVPDDAKDKIFEAFYTSKPHGLGLGLVSVTACAEAYGGSVDVSRSDLGGAAFRVRLPRNTKET
jgi:signal transduction histidine kinase